MTLDRNSIGIISRDARDDGTKALAVLKKHYLRDTHQRYHQLWHSFITSKMQDEEVNIFLYRMDDTIAKLTDGGEQISDKLKVVVLLNSLPTKFDNFVAIANQRNPPYRFEELKIALLNEEDRCIAKENQSEQVMVTSDYKPRKSPFKNEKKKNTHYTGNKWCDYHKSRRHNASECYDKDKHDNPHTANTVREAESISQDGHEFSFYVEDDVNSQDEHEFTFHVEDHVSMVSHEGEEYILVDSGCTSHIEKKKSTFVAMKNASQH